MLRIELIAFTVFVIPDKKEGKFKLSVNFSVQSIQVNEIEPP